MTETDNERLQRSLFRRFAENSLRNPFGFRVSMANCACWSKNGCFGADWTPSPAYSEQVKQMLGTLMSHTCQHPQSTDEDESRGVGKRRSQSKIDHATCSSNQWFKGREGDVEVYSPSYRKSQLVLRETRVSKLAPLWIIQVTLDCIW